MTKKFIIEPMPKRETRFVADREQDKKKVTVGEVEYTILPLTPVLRQRVYEEADKKEKAKLPIMQSWGWDSEKSTNYLKAHAKPLIERTTEDLALITRYFRDNIKAEELAVSEVDESLVFEILDSCVVLVDGKKPKDITMEWEDIYSLLEHIEDHSCVDESDRLAL